MPREDPDALHIVVPPDQRAGVWANAVQVSHSEHEFTLDFVRVDPITRGRGIVVARVSVSHLFLMRLIELLEADWQRYAAKTMPREVRDDDDQDDPDQPEA